uniref:Uncharacterized protein n=1 Tax=Glossina brevipalpis TaxID=37001 RepID=A0A1A9WC68_9MUSC
MYLLHWNNHAVDARYRARFPAYRYTLSFNSLLQRGAERQRDDHEFCSCHRHFVLISFVMLFTLIFYVVFNCYEYDLNFSMVTNKKNPFSLIKQKIFLIEEVEDKFDDECLLYKQMLGLQSP